MSYAITYGIINYFHTLVPASDFVGTSHCKACGIEAMIEKDVGKKISIGCIQYQNLRSVGL